MTLMILFVAIAAAVVAAVALTALVDLLRHDGAGRSGPRSHPADQFDPYAQRFGRCA